MSRTDKDLPYDVSFARHMKTEIIKQHSTKQEMYVDDILDDITTGCVHTVIHKKKDNTTVDITGNTPVDYGSTRVILDGQITKVRTAMLVPSDLVVDPSNHVLYHPTGGAKMSDNYVFPMDANSVEWLSILFTQRNIKGSPRICFNTQQIVNSHLSVNWRDDNIVQFITVDTGIIYTLPDDETLTQQESWELSQRRKSYVITVWSAPATPLDIMTKDGHDPYGYGLVSRYDLRKIGEKTARYNTHEFPHKEQKHRENSQRRSRERVMLTDMIKHVNSGYDPDDFHDDDIDTISRRKSYNY